MNSVLNIEIVRLFIKEWNEQKKFQSIRFKEDLSPVNDANDDYKIIYCASYSSEDLSMAEVEIVISADYSIGVNIDKIERVYRRLGKSIISPRVLTGFEPIFISLDSLKIIMDMISSGNIHVSYFKLPIFGVSFAKPFIEKEYSKKLKAVGIKNLYFAGVESSTSNFFKEVLRFSPWK